MPISIGLGTYFGGAGAAIGGSMGLVGQYGSMMLGAQYLPFGIGEKLKGTPKATPDISGGAPPQWAVDLMKSIKGDKG